MDEFELFEQPHCPNCGAVLRDFEAGYRCDSCKRLFLRTQVDSDVSQTEFEGGAPAAG